MDLFIIRHKFCNSRIYKKVATRILILFLCLQSLKKILRNSHLVYDFSIAINLYTTNIKNK